MVSGSSFLLTLPEFLFYFLAYHLLFPLSLIIFLLSFFQVIRLLLGHYSFLLSLLVLFSTLFIFFSSLLSSFPNSFPPSHSFRNSLGFRPTSKTTSSTAAAATHCDIDSFFIPSHCNSGPHSPASYPRHSVFFAGISWRWTQAGNSSGEFPVERSIVTLPKPNYRC